MAQQLVTLELDDKEKETFQELQQAMQKANQEMAITEAQARKKMQIKREAELTKHELEQLGESCPAYKQVGKMFLQANVQELTQTFASRIEQCTKETNALKEKHAHVEEAAKKLGQELQDFIKSHIANVEGAAS